MAAKKRSYSSKSSGYYKKRSTVVSRAKGNFKASNKGNDVLSFVVNSNHVFTARYNPATEEGTACVNVWDVLQRNPNFNSLKSMYDQVRIDGIRVKLSITDAITSTNNIGQIRNITVCTAWDRTGISLNQTRFLRAAAVGESGPQEITPSEYDNEKVIGWKTKIGSSIVNNTTIKKSMLSSFQRWSQYLSCYPSILNEKGQYIQTGDIKQFTSKTNQNTSYNEVNNSYDFNTVNEIISSSNPVIPFESSVVRFKPCLLVSVFSNGVSEAGQITQFASVSYPIIFNGEWSIACTFRNLKGSAYVLNIYIDFYFKLLFYFIFDIFILYINIIGEKIK